MSEFTILEGDVLDRLADLPEESFDACLTDPPYGLSEKRNMRRMSPRKSSREKAGGFMGMKWDSDVPGPEVWAEVLRVLKPGAMLLAFGGTRTHHRLWCAIEDAGFELKDCVMWLHGQGFPKSANISKNIDKAAGAEREVVGVKRSGCRAARGGDELVGGGTTIEAEKWQPTTAPATDAAKTWDGYGTALKPSFEPLCLAMKPLDGTFANNALTHGVAGLNVDGARIRTAEQVRDVHACERLASLCSSLDMLSLPLEPCRDVLLYIVFVLRSCSTGYKGRAHSASVQGDKWPVGVGISQTLLRHSLPSVDVCALRWSSIRDSLGDCPACLRSDGGLLHQAEAAARESVPSLLDVLDDICQVRPGETHSLCCQSSVPLSSSDVLRLVSSCLNLLLRGVQHHYSVHSPPPPGGRWPANIIHDGSEEVVRGFPETKGQQGAVTGDEPSSKTNAIYGDFNGRPATTPRGDSGSAARFFYVPKADATERRIGGVTNNHPTVKPVDLCAYLAKLILPPERDSPRRILVPYSGSGSEVMGALRAGWNQAVGIDDNPKYVAMSRERILGDSPMFNREIGDKTDDG